MDLNEQSQICGQSLLARSKPSPVRTWLLRWKRENWTQHLSGRILKPSLGQSFVEKWTSSLVDTPVNHSPPLASDLELKTPDISGPSSQMELDSCSPEFASLRTSKDTSASDSEQSLKNWEASVTKRRGAYSARVKLARLTKEKGSSSWPTANARDWKDGEAAQSQRALDAGHQVTLARAATCWSTPSTMMGAMYAESNMEKRNSPSLASQVVMWPTPTTAEAGKISCCPNYGQLGLSNHPDVHGYQVNRPKLEKSRSGLVALENPSTDGSRPESWATPIVGDSHLVSTPEVAAKRLAEGKISLSRQNAGKLNPRWVETLMGVPVGWTMPSCASPVTIVPTNSDSSVTELSLPQQPELF